MIAPRLRRLDRRIPARAGAALSRVRTPCWAEPLHVAAFPLVAGPSFRGTRRVLEASQRWSPAQVEELSLRGLRTVLRTAYDGSPYYRRLFDGAGLRPSPSTTPEELRRLPLLDKETVRARLAELQVAGADRRGAGTRLTSGTTSPPFTFPESASAWGFDAAFAHRWMGWHGCRIGERVAQFRVRAGRHTVDYNPLTNVLTFSVRGLDAATVRAILEEVAAFSPVALRGYPSVLTTLASEVACGGPVALPRLRRVFTYGESLSPRAAAAIGGAFGVPVADFYAMSERAALFQQCPRGGLLHVMCEYAHVELLREDGAPAAAGERATVVGTGFANRLLPFVRYATGDWVVPAAEAPCPDCGRPYRSVEAVEGRDGDFVKTPSGAWVSPTALELDDMPDVAVVDFCYRQTGLRTVVLEVVPGPGFTPAHGERVAAWACTWLDDPGMEVRLEVVPAIVRAPGKRRFVVSDVPGPLDVWPGGAGERA